MPKWEFERNEELDLVDVWRDSKYVGNMKNVGQNIKCISFYKNPIYADVRIVKSTKEALAWFNGLTNSE